MSAEGEKMVKSREGVAHLANLTSTPPPGLPTPHIRRAKGMGQTRASCLCGLFIPCNQSLFCRGCLTAAEIRGWAFASRYWMTCAGVHLGGSLS